MRFLSRLLPLALLVISVISATGLGVRPAPAKASAVAGPGADCQSVDLPVALRPQAGLTQDVAGTYCEPYQWASGPHEVDVLTPGASYNRLYWNWPVDPELYSYVDKTLAAGRATFDYDRVGTGASSHPPSGDITISADAYVLHQIVAWLRGTRGYGQVNLVGHSLGSVISVQEAGRYHDVNRVVVTGLLQVPDVGIHFVTTLESLLYPAATDPQFTGSQLDAGYLTTIPGDRAADFYSGSADPAVISYDEAHKDVVASTDLTTLATTWALPAGLNLSDSITAPVLVVIGEQDAIFCTDPPVLDCDQPSELLATEAPYFTGASSLTVDSIPGTGHDVALHPTADQSFSLINDWIGDH
ncbi:MAG TPA: alpha/beta hydrolase [Streptosporangiaceae bacterium]|nr:alpha/beta hydrolase [Streptosporangiaceae bacterium]